jgi:hypothetical protein
VVGVSDRYGIPTTLREKTEDETGSIFESANLLHQRSCYEVNLCGRGCCTTQRVDLKSNEAGR